MDGRPSFLGLHFLWLANALNRNWLARSVGIEHSHGAPRFEWNDRRRCRRRLLPRFASLGLGHIADDRLATIIDRDLLNRDLMSTAL